MPARSAAARCAAPSRLPRPYAAADSVEVIAGVEEGRLRITVRDDGAGGADRAHGSGLTGLRDRVEALGGTIEITSPDRRRHLLLPTVGAGTSLVGRIPIEHD